MATVKISELPSAQDIGAADEVLVVQDGKTCKAKGVCTARLSDGRV